MKNNRTLEPGRFEADAFAAAAARGGAGDGFKGILSQAGSVFIIQGRAPGHIAGGGKMRTRDKTKSQSRLQWEARRDLAGVDHLLRLFSGSAEAGGREGAAARPGLAGAAHWRAVKAEEPI